MFEEIFEEIRKAPVITIFRHTEPDMDALGSQMGLKKALQHIFPEKEIYVLGQQTRNGFVMDEVEDEVIPESLGILVDTSSSDRIDDQRFFDTAKKIRFDHHIKTEEIGDLDYVDEKAGASGEVLADFFRDLNQEIGAEAAQDLYQALSADTARYTTSNTRPESLEAGAWLLRQGASVIRTDQVNNGISMNDFKYGALIRRKATREDRLLFAVMSKTDWMTCGLDEMVASKKAFMLGGVREIDIWALFTEVSDGSFVGSLRSRTREVRDIAAQYGGGGHMNAAGLKGLSASQVVDIIRLLQARSVESEEDRLAREKARKEEEARKEAEAVSQSAINPQLPQETEQEQSTLNHSDSKPAETAAQKQADSSDSVQSETTSDCEPQSDPQMAGNQPSLLQETKSDEDSESAIRSNDGSKS